MTEQEYIDATNLAKVTAAKDVLRNALFSNPKDEDNWAAAMSAMQRLELRLQSLVNVRT